MLYLIEFSKSVPVSRTTLMAIAPSDSRGTNSEPRFGAMIANATNISAGGEADDQRFVLHRELAATGM